MAVSSLYDNKSFLNRRRKSPVNFSVEQNNLSAMRALLERAAPVLTVAVLFTELHWCIAAVDGRKDAISARKTGQSCANASSGWLTPINRWGIGVVVLKGQNPPGKMIVLTTCPE